MSSLPLTFLGLDPVENTFEGSAAVVLPVPYDATASYKAGAREGPAAIIAASREMEDYDFELGCEPCARGIHTAAPLEPQLDSPAKMNDRVRSAVRRVAAAGKLPIVLGGDHSISIGSVQAIAELHEDLSTLYLDAHADYRDAYQGTRWGHASSARRIAEVCPLTLAGVRSMAIEEAAAVRDTGTPLYSAPVTRESWSAIGDGLSGHVYISVDLDVLDPSLMPAVGTPEPGGLGWHEALGLLRYIAERKRIAGFDIVELAPGEGPGACAYTAAKLAYKLMAYATALPAPG